MSGNNPWAGWPPSPPVVIPPPEPFPSVAIGLSPDTRRPFVGGSAAAAGGTFDYPGPAAGFVRFYEATVFTANPIGAVTAVRVAINPGNRAIIVNGATATNSGFSIVMPPIGVGESVRVTNAGATPIFCAGSYFDIPDTGITLVRTTATFVAATTVVPAAGVGTRNAILIGTRMNGLGTVALFTALTAFNADSVGHQLILLRGGVFNSRSASAGTNATLAIQGAYSADVTTDPLQVQLQEAVVTLPVNVFCAYQTVAV